MSKKIESLQIIRAIACIMVILDHTEMGQFYDIGQFGVCLFLLISGFVMVLSTERNTKNIFIKRFFRVAPFYYLMTPFAIVLGLIVPQLMRVSEINLFNVVKSFLFISAKGSNGVYNPILGVGWTLNLEMAFYALFTIATRINKKYRAVITGAVLTFLNVLYYVFGIDHFYTQPYIMFIVFGMILYYVYKYLDNVQIPMFVQYIGCIISFSVVVLVLVINPKMEINWMLPAALICVASLVLISKDVAFNRALLYIGDISYSIYLTHTFIIKGFIRIIRPVTEFNAVNLLFVVIYVVVAIAIGAIAYNIIEKNLFKKTIKSL